MSSTLKALSAVEHEIEITIPASEIDSKAQTMTKNIAKRAQIKGFRPGKAPVSIVKRMYGESIFAELTSDLMYKTFMEAIQEHELSPIGEPEFPELGEPIKPGKDFTFCVKVETRPKLDSICVDGIELTKEKITISENEIEAILKQMQSRLATTEALKDTRPVKIGDQLTLEITPRPKDGDNTPPAPRSDTIVLEKGECPEEFLDALVGTNIGDEVVVTMTSGPAPMTLQCEIKEIFERTLPLLDDEFAKDVGEFDTLEELRADIVEQRTEEAEENARRQLKRQLFDALLEKNPMTLPPGLLKKQTDYLHSTYQTMIDKVPPDERSNELSQDMQTAATRDAQKTAQTTVHTHFLNEEIARIYELQVSDEDVDAFLQKMSDMVGLPVAKIKAQIFRNQSMSEMKERILEDKIFDYLKPKVRIVEVEPTKQDAAAEADTSD